MSADFVLFDDIEGVIRDTVRTSAGVSDSARPIFLIRNLFGRIRVLAPDAIRDDGAGLDGLRALASALRDRLGARAALGGEILFVDPALLASVRPTAREILPGVLLAERLVIGADWWTVAPAAAPGRAPRYTLYSVKGGVGRSTTAAVLARHLAANGRRVLVVDLDLESPGLASAVLEPDRRPDFGVVDWFVEELVGQGEQVVGKMVGAPHWAQTLEGEVRVAPAHGREPGDYLGKLGRSPMDTVKYPWSARLRRLLGRLEAETEPDLVLVESRSGLHDIAAATVTDLNAQVLLFATDSASTWADYAILFRHWRRHHDLAAAIRSRLSIVSALTPELDTARYLERFRERSWDLFREHLYDRVGPSDGSEGVFSFDLPDEGAPHDPLVIHWTRGLAAGASLVDLERTAANQAYRPFLERFDDLGRVTAAAVLTGGLNGSVAAAGEIRGDAG